MKPARAKKTAEDVPISVRFPRELRDRTERYAREHRVAVGTAIRMIVGDHLDELDEEAGLSRAELWQRARAWSVAQSIAEPSPPETTWDELRAIHAAAVKRGRARRTSG